MKEKLIEILNDIRQKRGSLDELSNNEIANGILALKFDMPSEKEIYEYLSTQRQNKLKGNGNMSIGRMQLGEVEWMNLCIDTNKWIMSEIEKRNNLLK